MSIRVYFGQQLELLANRLGENIRAEVRAASEPFPESVILVPNVNVRKWLQLALAERLSVSMGCRFMFLEDGLWELALAAVGGPEIKRLDRQTLQTMVLSVLRSVCGEEPAEPELAVVLAPFVQYCRVGSGARDTARRLWQLSGRLAGLLLDYEYHREEMIDEWCAEGGSGSPSAMETAQRALYRRLFVGPRSVAARMEEGSGTVYRSLYRVMQQFQPADGFAGGAVHMFGLSQFSPFYVGLLFQLARFYDVRLYDINVCSEFWEDVSTPEEDAWQARWRKVASIALKPDPPPGDLEADLLEPRASDNYLLKAWGKLGREKLKLISEVEERSEGRIEFEADWIGAPDSAGVRTLLSAVQDSILRRRGSGDGPCLDRHDATVQVVGCPGVMREAETVYNSIIHNMAATPGLRLTDIAVLVPDMGAYKSALVSVFSRHPGRIPFSLTDSKASVDSIYARAVVSLLELADSPFTRSAVFELILNPCFLARAGVARETALDWLGWADALGIFHSFDREHRERQEYGEGNRYTWEQGLQRLRLGRIMEQPSEYQEGVAGSAERISALRGESPAFEHYRGVVPFEDLHSRDADSVSRFSVAVERTYRRLRSLGSLTASGAVWAGQVRRLLSQFLDVPADHAREAGVRGVLFAALDGLATYDAASRGSRESAGLRLPLVTEFVKSCLVDIPSHYGSYLTDGVTISELRPMRPIPFRLVYVLGMKEGDFPGMAEPTTLDLRHRARRLGDLAPAMVNRYLFLEALVSTREKLIVTYPCENTKEDKPFNPCSVVNELKRFMEEQILRTPFEIQRVPLTGADVAYLEAVCATESGANRDIFSNYDHAERRVALIAAQRMGRLADGARAERETVSVCLPAAPPEQAAAPAPSVEIVTLRQLRQFLANPVEASVMRHLRLRDERDDDRAVAETEPFNVGGVEQWSLVMQTLRSVVLDPGLDWRSHLDALYADRLNRSAVPEFVFGDRARERLSEAVASVVGEDGGLADLAARLREGGGPFRNVAIGEPGNDGPSDLEFPPVRLSVTADDGRPREVEIHGSLPFCWRGGAGELVTLVLMTGEYKPSRAIHLAEAFLFYAAAVASGVGSDLYESVSGGPFTVCVAAKGGLVAGPDGPCRYRLLPEEAAAYLEALVRDYLDPSMFDLLPFPVVLHKELVQPYNDTSVREHLAHTAGTGGGGSMADVLKAEFPDGDGDALGRLAAEYPARLTEAIDEELGKQFGRAYYPMDVLDIVDVRVPDDAFLKVRRRLRPLLGGGDT